MMNKKMIVANDVRKTYRNASGRIEDNVGQRLGVGIAVSIGLNSLLLFGWAFAEPIHQAQAAPTSHPEVAPTITVRHDRKQPVSKPIQNSSEQPVEVTPQEKEFDRPQQTPPVRPSVQKEHGPRVVVAPVIRKPVTSAESVVENQPASASGQSAATGQPQAQQSVAQQHGGAVVAGNPFESTGVAQRTAELAASHSVSAAAMVGGSIPAIAASAETAASAVSIRTVKAPIHVVDIGSYIPVVAVNRRESAATFSVPVVESVRTPSAAGSRPVPAFASVATMGTGSAVTSIASAASAFSAAPRSITVRAQHVGTIYRSTGGTTLAARSSEASVEVAGATGGGSGLAGRSQGAVDFRRNVAAVGTASGSLSVTGDISNVVSSESGTGTGPRAIAATGGTGLRGSTGNRGGVASSVIGGEGQIHDSAGTTSGTVKLGKVGGDIQPIGSVGVSGTGPITIIGEGGDSHTGPGRIGGHLTDLPNDLPEAEVIEDGAVVAQRGAKVVSKPTFVLPDGLQKRSVKGVVEVRVQIKADGSTVVSLKKTSGDAELDAAVQRYISGWKWEAAQQQSSAIDSARIIRFRVN